MIKKQITFQSNYNHSDNDALVWLSDLSKCFSIMKASMTSYIKQTEWSKQYCCKVEVQYE